MADKGKKVGRNKTVCAAYRANGTRMFNKARRLKRYLKKRAHRNDGQAWKALEAQHKQLFSNQQKALGMAEFLKRRP